jgi:hypothetical protein
LEQTKALVQSRVFWASMMSLVAVVAGGFHLSSLSTWAASPGSIDFVFEVVSGIGSIAAIIFRAKATHEITSVLPPAPLETH